MNPKNVIGIIGHPVSHSLSPKMQNAALKDAGLDDWIYVPMAVHKFPYIRLKEAVLGLRALGFRGVNVTVPFKEAVLPYLDRLSASARAIGAVNTIVVESDDQLVGHNTDGLGFIKDLEEHGILVMGSSVLLLGAGGSARAVGHALLDSGCGMLLILNRTKSKAEELASVLLAHFPDKNIQIAPLEMDAFKKLPYTDLIINCTSLGMKEDLESMPWNENVHFTQGQIVYDLIYNPPKTKLLALAEKDGAKTLNGLGMLLHQGAAAFELWTGLSPSLQVMKNALLP